MGFQKTGKAERSGETMRLVDADENSASEHKRAAAFVPVRATTPTVPDSEEALSESAAKNRRL